MRAPIVFLCLSSGFAGLSYLLSGQTVSDLTLFFVVTASASAIIFLLSIVRPSGPKRARGRTERWVVVDGSNVMHWKDNTPLIDPVRDVVRRFAGQGCRTGVVFDANAGYKLAGRYVGDAEFAKLLGLPRDQIFVVPRGTQADPFLLASARDLGARIVTNDRFRDWEGNHPEVRTKGHLIQGGYRDGVLWLDDKALTPA